MVQKDIFSKCWDILKKIIDDSPDTNISLSRDFYFPHRNSKEKVSNKNIIAIRSKLENVIAKKLTHRSPK